ncbi:MAG: spore protease YyaC [Bacillota bacterium]
MQSGRRRSWFSPPLPREQKFDSGASGCAGRLATAVVDYSCALEGDASPVVVLCIGTDRSTGDSLGPLVGTFLAERPGLAAQVFGTLDSPVHAANLQEVMDWLKVKYERPLVVAVDACLGRLDSVGTVTVGEGPLRPGAGVNKSLPSVGDVHVTGVVNVGGFMEYFVLQNTRLNLVMKMSRVISTGVAEAVARLEQMRGSAAVESFQV